MVCPRCQEVLSSQTRLGVIIEVCDRCAGVWMDRGEVGKMLTEFHALQRELSAAATADPGDDSSLPRLRRRLAAWARLVEVFAIPAPRG